MTDSSTAAKNGFKWLSNVSALGCSGVKALMVVPQSGCQPIPLRYGQQPMRRLDLNQCDEERDHRFLAAPPEARPRTAPGLEKLPHMCIKTLAVSRYTRIAVLQGVI